MTILQSINRRLEEKDLSLKNRFVMPPMVTLFATPEGYISERQIAYYLERAKGGAGLIVVEEAAAISPEGAGAPCWLRLNDDAFVPGLERLTELVHSHDAKIMIQLAHAGRQTSSEYSGLEPVAPSPIPCAPFGEVPRALSIEEIETIKAQFGEAAKRASDAGFDGVEIHGAHGYLIHQFLSPRTNHRKDKYGGYFLGRTRFLTEILMKVKNEVPPGFVVGCRLNGEDYVKGGLHGEDAKKIALQAASCGVSYLHISCGVPESIHMTIAPMDVVPGFLAPFAGAVKKEMSVPVIAVGRITDPLQADLLIEEGKADLAAMGRALWADPHLPRKALEGRFDEIRPCIGCNQGCRKKTDRCCLMNPETSRERKFEIYPAKQSKRVLVAGGGPAGMEFARVATLRGHEVTILERSSQLGGNFRLASVPPKRTGILKGIHYLEREIRRLNVRVEKEKELRPEELEEFQFDELIIATGAVPVIPPIAGLESNNLIFAEDVLLEKKRVSNRVLVIGGGMVGCEVADFLSDKGKRVILTEMLPDIRPHADPPSSRFIRERLRDQKVQIRTNCKVEKISGDEVIIEREGVEDILKPIDDVIIAAGYKARRKLVKSLDSSSYNIRIIGDAVEARDALRAIYEGSKAAREI